MKTADASYRVLAARYMRRQANKLDEQLDGILRAEDIECIHQARVASRRLRAALRMFGNCFKRKHVKRWRRAIRRVTIELGEARDLDVQIEFLVEVLDRLSDKSCYPAVAQLLARFQRKRERLQGPTVEAVERLRASGVIGQIRKVERKVISQARANKVPSRSPAARSEAAVHLMKSLETLVARQQSLADPQAVEEHHAMRIDAKRLRYTAEIAAPLYDGQLDETVKALKQLQSLLGDLHDCDVWLDHLALYAEKRRRRIRSHFGHDGPFVQAEPGLDYLREDRAEHRREVFGELVAYWDRLQTAGHWKRLEEIAGDHFTAS